MQREYIPTPCLLLNKEEYPDQYAGHTNTKYPVNAVLPFNVFVKQADERIHPYDLLILPAIAIAATIKQKSLRLLAILPLTICIYYFVDDMRTGRLLPSAPFAIVFLVSVFYFLYTYSSKHYFSELYQRRLIILLGLFTLCFLIFSAFNFVTSRYLLTSLVPMLFIVAICIDKMSELAYRWLYYPAVAGILVVAFFTFKDSTGHGDIDMNAFKALAVQQGVVDYLEAQQAYDKNISTGSYLESEHLKDPATGFLHSQKAFKNVVWELDGHTYYAIFDNIEPDNRYEQFKKDTVSFQLVQRIKKGNVWAEMYKRK